MSLPAIATVRLSKAALAATVGGFGALAAFGNLTDYGTNLSFVRHVLSMDDQRPELAAVSRIDYRAIKAGWAHHLAYNGVTATETFIAASCLRSSWRMLRARRADDRTFGEAKNEAILGCTAGLGLWFFGFQGVAGEWFGMWKNEHWNGLPDAVRLCNYLSAVLIVLNLPEPRP